MRLRLFDRIRRLAHPRRAEAAGSHGRHRRDQRHVAPAGPSSGPEGVAPAGPPSGPEGAAPAGPSSGLEGAAPAGPSSGPEGRPGPGHPSGPLTRAAAPPPDAWPVPGPSTSRDAPSVPAGRFSGSPAVRVGGARARVREAPDPAAAPGAPANWNAGPSAELAHAEEAAAAASRTAAHARGTAGVPPQATQPSWRPAHARLRLKLPFVAPHQQGRSPSADGRRHCGSLETIVWRQWDAGRLPPPEVVEAIDRLAELPEQIKERLAAGLDSIFVGPGGVPELDEMTALRGVRLPSGQASWDACAGAYGDRKIVVGTQPSPTPDVMCHEVGHALDDLDSPPGRWQSDSAEFRMLYDQCQPHLASDFHCQPGGLGRKEFFADAFAAIASGQRPALVDMLSGDTRTALRVMLYFNRRYGI
jgi:hypothetical protein